MRAALRWACESGAVTAGLRLVTALWAAWMDQGLVREGAAWGERLLGLVSRDTAAMPAALRAQALHATARVVRCFDHMRARALAEDSLDLYGVMADQAGRARVLVELGGIAEDQDQVERASHLYQEALALGPFCAWAT